MAESIQKKLLRVRPPRVRITYDVETGGAIEKRELPFIVGVLADLTGARDEKNMPLAIKERRMIDIDRDKFNDVMKTIGPSVSLLKVAKTSPTLSKLLSKPADKTLTFRCMDDFEPLAVIQGLPSLNERYQARGQIRALQARLEADDEVANAIDAWMNAQENDDAERGQIQMREQLIGALARADGAPAAPLQANDKPAPKQEAAGETDGKTQHDTQGETQGETEGGATDATNTSEGGEQQAKAAGETKPSGQAQLGSASEQLKALMALAAKVPAESAGETAATPEELKALRQCGLLAAAAEPDTTESDAAKPDPTALAAARRRARMIVAALSEENTQAGRLLTQKILCTPDNKVDTLDSEEKALRKALRGQLGEDADAFCAGFEKLDAARKDGAQWPEALVVLGCARASAGQEAVGEKADSRERQAAMLTARERRCVLDLIGYTKDQPVAPQNAADTIFTLLERTASDGAGKMLMRLHYFASEVLACMQGADADNAVLQHARRGGAAAAIDQRVAQIDHDLSLALSDIMHSPGFQQIEATWRGLAHLVFNTETSTMLKLRVFNATKEELLKDMTKAVEFDQSTLFKLIYEREYGSYGGTPYSLLVGDYYVGGSQQDIDFLKKMAEVAAAAHAPFLAAASESMFGIDSFASLDKPRDLKKVFESQELAGWREFRELEDARYVSLALPRVLLRLPYGQPDRRNTIPCEALNYEEQVSVARTEGVSESYPDPANGNFLWGNPAYVLAERITNAFAIYNWTAAIRGVEGGGLVESLPMYTYTSNAGMTELFCPTEVAITDRREKELNDLGFISLCHCKGTGKAAFFGGQTTNQPKKYFSDDANANARISAMLPYMLAASRFAHYIKVIMRDKIGSFLTRANVESYLNTWIANYVLLDDNASQEVKSAYPLRAASVIVTEAPGEPGSYRATVFLQPHFQLEELTTSIRLVANLPA